MRHRVFGKKLNRDIKRRKALFKGLIISLITYGRVRTTVAKAKAVASLTEKLVTLAKDGSHLAVRKIASTLNRKAAIEKLTKTIVPRFKGKIGGYIRIIRIGRRQGDNAEEVILEWSVGAKKDKGKKPQKDKLKKEAEDKK